MLAEPSTLARQLSPRDERHETVLRSRRIIEFEFDAETGEQLFSPFISEFIAGRYDGRLLSRVMEEDGVIHPDDLSAAQQFRRHANSGQPGELTLRLKTPEGPYHWFSMTLIPCLSVGPHYFIGVLADVDKEEKQRRLLRYRAEFDAVSDIFNKSTFYEQTTRLLSEDPRPHDIVRFDIDRFKLVNELYSISEGDLLLRHIGEVLKELTAPGETYGRMRDDVFCICLSRSRREVIRLTEQLEQRINDYPLPFQFILSIGILHLEHYDGQPVHILCDRAALAQQTVKSSYIQRYAFYEPWMSESLNREHYLTGCMYRALKEGQFRIYLQPIFDVANGRMTGAEALARWQNPIDGLILPGEFIPLFERNGFILKLDEYIWEQTCQCLRNWLNLGLNPPPISVNVSRVHLHDPDFCARIRGMVEKYRLPPGLLELEITESAYTECSDSLYGVMDELRGCGFVFLMDDFGSGYSSLNTLKDIPVDRVKIDLNFLRAARRGTAVGRRLLQGTVRLMQELELPVVAEGVETGEQADFLREIGCALAQGYHFARPMPVKDFEDNFLPDLSTG